MAQSGADESGLPAAPRAWLRGQARLGRPGAWRVVACSLAGVALAIGQAWCAASALGHALRPDAAPAPVGWLIAGFLAAVLLRAGLALLAEGAAFEAGAAARRRLRTEALSRILAAGPVALGTRHSGELAALAIDRIEALDGFFGRWLPAATLALAGPALVLLAVLAADPVDAAILAGAGLLVPLGMALAGIGAAAASRRQFAAMARLQARFVDRIRGLSTIVMYGAAEEEARSLAGAADELRRRTLRVLRLAFLSSAALDCAAAAALVFIAVRAAGGAAGGLFALLLVPEFFAPLRAFAAAYQDRMHAIGAAEALTSLPAVPPEPAPLPVRTVEARGVAVAFEDVRFAWDPARPPALDGLTFRVAAGETLVLAGPSGAGKSTVIALLLGFIRPQSGRITLNGADIATLTAPALSRLTAWIGQRPLLFAGTLAENIRFARPEATEAELAEAVRLARVEGFAATLPQGLDTPIGEGGWGLSGGQAQRVAIARAFLRNAPLLLLDEPTAHLDPATEAEVLDGLRRLVIGRTVVLASHASAAHVFPGHRLDLVDGRAVPVRGVA